MSTSACPACLGTNLRKAFPAAGIEYLRCRRCGTLIAAERPAPEELSGTYSGREYFTKADPGGGDTLWGYADDYLADRANVEAKFAGVLEQVERDVTPGRLLDVGCGPGFMLDVAGRRGWNATGVDLNEWAVGEARSAGLDARIGGIAGQGFEGAEFDAVTMLDLIEHVPDPDQLLSEVAAVLRPGGALAVLTPDAGSPVSRALGRRWPEVRRPGEHLVVFSRRGLIALLDRHGLTATGFHSVGKKAPLSTLVADAAPLAPGPAGVARRVLDVTRLGRRVVDLDPRTKLVVFARRRPEGSDRRSGQRTPRLPKEASRTAGVDEAILDELGHLADARRLCRWMFDQFRPFAGPRVAEVGAGIGTFSERLLDEGATDLLLVEPEPSCAGALEARFGADERVRIAREALPDAPSLAQGGFDLVLCQNVLEHIADDAGALRAMASALAPGGTLAILVPAGPRLFGSLDSAYGHWRRYRRDELRALLEGAGLEVDSLRHFNALGIVGWWAKNRRPGARVGPGSLRAYEALVALWRPIEDRLRPPVGLSLVAIARRPA